MSEVGNLMGNRQYDLIPGVWLRPPPPAVFYTILTPEPDCNTPLVAIAYSRCSIGQGSTFGFYKMEG